MSFRGAIKKGGGFLNGVDGELQGYEFTLRFKGEKKDSDNLYFVPTILVDGSSEPIDQHLFVGKADRYEISEDGQELTMADGSPVTFPFSLPFGRFIDSMIEKGFDESELPDLEAGEPLNLSAAVGTRFRFMQEVDERGNATQGKRKVKDKKTGKIKEYDRTNTVIAAVLGASNGNSNGKAAKPAAAGKGKSKEVDFDEEAADVLRDVLGDNSISRKQLSLPVAKALMKNANKDELKKLILSEEWQESQDWLSVDKKGNLSIA